MMLRIFSPEESEEIPITDTPSEYINPTPALVSPKPDRPSQGQPKTSMETALEPAIEKVTEQIGHAPDSFLEFLPKELQKQPQETQQTSRQDNTSDNPSASFQGYVSASVPKVMLVRLYPRLW